jgi:PEGA domain
MRALYPAATRRVDSSLLTFINVQKSSSIGAVSSHLVPRPSRLILPFALLFLLACAGVAAAQPADAPAEPPPDTSTEQEKSGLSQTLKGIARAEYEGGKVLFADGDYKNAIVKFQKAHDVSKDPRLLWNIAVCQKNLRHYSKMLVSVRRYRNEAKDWLSDEDRRQADAIVDTVKTFISDFVLVVNVADAEVFVDGEPIGVTPLKGRSTLDVGRREIRIERDGYGPQVRNITVVGGGRVELKVDLLKTLHRGTLVVATVDEAMVAIDGKMVGRGGWRGSLASGGHTLRVTAVDMQPFQQEVVIQDDATRTVEVELIPVATDSTATILWVVGGVTLASAAIVTGALLFSPSGEEPVDGSIPPGSVQLSTGRASSGLTVWSW